MQAPNLPAIRAVRPACHLGRVVGLGRPLLPTHVWTFRVRLEIAENHRNPVILKVSDFYATGQVNERSSIIQSKTQKPVRFEITKETRTSPLRWISKRRMIGSEFLRPNRFHERPHISTRQFARRSAFAWTNQDGQHHPVARRRT